MIEVPDVMRYLIRVLGFDEATATLAIDLAERPVRTHKTAEAAYETLAAALGVDEDRARSVLFTVESMISQVMGCGGAVPVDANHLFLYFGPVDNRTRPFCLEHVGKVYTLRRIRALDNGQLPDVLLTRGGWECRHHWTPLSEFNDLKRFADTGERIPDVAQDFAYLLHCPVKDPTAPVHSDEEPEGPGDPPWARWPRCPGPLRG